MSLPAHLLTPPPKLPNLPRSAAGMTGAQCTIGGVDLYDVAGAIRLQLLELIAAEKARTAR